MLASQEGDRDAYNELLSELLAFLRGYCGRAMMGASQVEDCVQEVLLSVHRALHSFLPSERFFPWFLTIARHKIIDHIRRSNGVIRCQSEFARAIESRGADQPDLDLAIDLNNLVEELSAKDRQMFLEGRILGFSNGEISEKLEVSVGSVKVRIHRITKLLRKRFESGY